MKTILLSFTLTCVALFSQAQVQVSKTINTRIYSATPLEDIDATNSNGVSAINTDSKAIYFKIRIDQFKFDKSLMQEHFNENYMESEKFPFAEYDAKITTPVDFSKDGTYNVTTSGDFTVHGVKKKREATGTITVKNGKVSINAKLDVKCADHNIEIPKVVVKNIAETIAVTISGDYNPK